MSPWFWDVKAPLMRTRAQQAAILAVQATAKKMIERIERSNTPRNP